jgi:transposase-like protein
MEESARITNAIQQLHEEFKRRIKTQTVLPSADTAAMLFWALLASGQIRGWRSRREFPRLSGRQLVLFQFALRRSARGTART